MPEEHDESAIEAADRILAEARSIPAYAMTNQCLAALGCISHYRDALRELSLRRRTPFRQTRMNWREDCLKFYCAEYERHAQQLVC